MRIHFIACCSLASLIVVAIAFAPLVGAQKFPETCANGSRPQFPTAATTEIESCGVSGDETATSAEGLQNAAKNNFCSQNTPAATTIAKLTALEKSAEKAKGFKASTPPASRSFLTALGEGQAVSFEGYVYEARQECEETVNCGTQSPNIDASHDIHLYLLGQPRKNTPGNTPAANAEECTGIVAEMNPHHRPPEWTACNVNDIANQGLRIRITGQQFFDTSHVPCKNGAAVGSNPRRVSLWEVHPIYTFDVCPAGTCATGGWVPLATFKAGSTTCVNPVCQQTPSSTRPAALVPIAAHTEQSSLAPARRLDRMQNTDQNTVVFFDSSASSQIAYRISDEEKQRYRSLSDYVQSLPQSVRSRICVGGVPTPPPPTCLICPDGSAVCTNARFSGK